MEAKIYFSLLSFIPTAGLECREREDNNYICQWRNFRNMSRGPREVILRPDVKRDVINSEGARGTNCGNCGIAYVVLLTDWRTIFEVTLI